MFCLMIWKILEFCQYNTEYWLHRPVRSMYTLNSLIKSRVLGCHGTIDNVGKSNDTNYHEGGDKNHVDMLFTDTVSVRF